MPARKPYQPGGEAAGESTAGMPPMGPQPGRMGPQPPQMMGGNPGMQGPPAPGGTQGMIGPSGHPQAQAGGPMAPGNIGQMLQAQVGPQGPPQPPQQAVGTLGPWGDQGTRPAGVNRAPFDPAALAPDADMMGGDDPLAMGGDGMQGGLPPGALMGLMRKLGRI